MPLRRRRVRADWYPDPVDPTRVRYWDGRRWTEQLAERDPLLTPDDRVAPSGRLPGEPLTARSRLAAVAWLTVPVLGYVLPLIGPAVSVAAAFAAVGRAGPDVWTRGGWPRGHRSAALAGAGALWLLPVLNMGALFTLADRVELTYVPGLASWLFLPLAGPANPLLPAVAALLVHAGGAALSVRARRPWPWVAGGVAASLAYDLTIVVAGIPWIS